MAITESQRVELVKLGIDRFHGTIPANFSAKKAQDTFYEGLVAANNGSTKITLKGAIRGEHNELFKIIEDILDVTVNEGLSENDFFSRFVETRNLDDGDSEKFWIPDNNYYYISDMARGNMSLNRQRALGGRYESVETIMHGAKIWERAERIMAGRVDFNQMIADLQKSVIKKKLDDAYNVFMNIPKVAGDTYRPVAGTYDEDALLEMIEHLETETGQAVTIMGRKSALRKLKVSTPADQSEQAKNDLYTMGYYGNFYGTECMALKNIHQTGTRDFLVPDKTIYLIAGDVKPVKHVVEGGTMIVPRSAIENADLSEEYFLGVNYGMKSIITDQFGVYSFT